MLLYSVLHPPRTRQQLDESHEHTSESSNEPHTTSTPHPETYLIQSHPIHSHPDVTLILTPSGFDFPSNAPEHPSPPPTMSNPHAANTFRTPRVHRDPDGTGLATTVFPPRSTFLAPQLYAQMQMRAQGGSYREGGESGRRGMGGGGGGGGSQQESTKEEPRRREMRERRGDKEEERKREIVRMATTGV
ncbi:hypothetical protein EX30DRAFT_390066 [Ascodesmis nigricans]|uniref:Uncharacterized protein n=1 Tax=Ascodesmis nigricans TaxID=341454 RepID=A0A4S2MI05_9PEZI|nr:hypothetical protein EX30DRAFT_390066 [Ascodesmis nigricans]